LINDFAILIRFLFFDELVLEELEEVSSSATACFNRLNFLFLAPLLLSFFRPMGRSAGCP